MKRLLLVALLAAACGGKKQDPEPSTPSGAALPEAGAGGSSAAPVDAAPPRADKGPSMFDYQRKQAFAEYASKQLGVGIEDLDGGAANDDIAKTSEGSVGDAYAFTMFVRGKHQQAARGWVLGDNTVITLEQNLGKLFEQAGAWDKQPKVTEDELAEVLLWAFGRQTATHNHMLDTSPTAKSPTLEMKKGAGTFTFAMAVRPSGPGGAGGGPQQRVTVTVTLTADRQATLSRS